MDCSDNPYGLLFEAISMIPISHYALGLLCILIVVLYNFLEFHLLEDLLTGFRGSPVSLTYNSCSEIYEGVASKCKILHGRYLATPWLASPHIQTTFLNFFGRPPAFSYRRHLFHASDGGTIALDWLLNTDVSGEGVYRNSSIAKDDTTPIMVVIPGLTSDSASAYLKHLAFNTAKQGWNVVVSNHRGLGGVSVTSDCFYNAGWTEDTRDVIDYLHREYANATLYAVGTSIGANILVKYLGEHGENVPVAGAVAICSPWDLLIGDRFISRRLVQKLYDRALCIGLQGYAQLHQPHYSRLADWEGIRKSRSIRDFDNYATCLVGKFETVDTYYRRCSSSSYVGNVSVPLLCVSALDDPLCTAEAIPWDECRANKNIVLATTKHGGHLAFFEGIKGSGLWWVRAAYEFLSILHCSPFLHIQKKTQSTAPHSSLESSIDQGPYINLTGGMVAAMGNELVTNDVVEIEHLTKVQKSHDIVTEEIVLDSKEGEVPIRANPNFRNTVPGTSKQPEGAKGRNSVESTNSIRRCLNQLFQQNRISMWLLGYIAIVSTWPLVGAALHFVFKKRLRSVLPANKA
ncbi:embryogenesis-associated protein EMB8 isoform X1 [Rhododendron vialii]|uniref:embryogenesis-associated protein EMB8 isoform X1 n=1 Tax=Rhododendron vialii TaxID=182163 RepID=UPI00265F4FAF|nr:embryogenesis-associated protein EMB8 isoform X1 [Rhododendron vialii]